MKRPCEMRIDTNLRRQSPSEDRSFEGAIVHAIEAVGNNRVNVCGGGKERVDPQDACRQLVIFVSHEGRLLQLRGNGLYAVNAAKRHYLRSIGSQRRCLSRHDQDGRIELGEHLFDQRTETVHYTEHTDHSCCNDRYSCSTNAGNDVDSVVSFLGEEVTPGNVWLQFQGNRVLFAQQLVDSFHTVDGLVEVENYLRNNAELMSLECAEFSAELMCVLLNAMHGLRHFVLRKNREVNMRDTEVRRDAHFAHGDECAMQCPCITKENVAHVFLYESCDFVLTCCFHRKNV